MSDEQPVIKRKVKAFPIPATVVGSAPPLVVQIVRLSTHGFLAETPGNTMKVSERLNLSFVLPVYNLTIECQAIVVKTYDRLDGQNDQRLDIFRLTEMHFLKLSEAHKSTIHRFLLAIGQI